MGLSKQVIRTLVRRIRAAAKPDRIILFGSAATGKMTRDSDIDLLVLEAGPVRKHEGARLRTAIGRVGYPMDVKAMSTERFARYKNVIGGIEYPAHKYGKVLYDSQPSPTRPKTPSPAKRERAVRPAGVREEWTTPGQM